MQTDQLLTRQNKSSALGGCWWKVGEWLTMYEGFEPTYEIEICKGGTWVRWMGDLTLPQAIEQRNAWCKINIEVRIVVVTRRVLEQ